LYIVKEGKYEKIDELIEERDQLLQSLKTLEREQIKLIKDNQVSTRNSVLYFNIITETKNLLLYMINMVKAQRDFVVHSQKKLIVK
jgi:Na+/phosphate symporter